MTPISQKKEEYPIKGYFDKEIKSFHKSKIDGLKKLSTRASMFYVFLHFKIWSYLNHKISFNLSVQVANYLVFHNPFMILFHILSPVLDHESMLDNFLITSSVLHPYSLSRFCVYLESAHSLSPLLCMKT